MRSAPDSEPDPNSVPCGPRRNSDPLHVEQIGVQHRGVADRRDRQLVDIDRDRALQVGAVAVGGDAAGGEVVEVGGGLVQHDAGRLARQALVADDALGRQVLLRKGGDAERHVLQALVAAGGGDHDLVEQGGGVWRRPCACLPGTPSAPGRPRTSTPTRRRRPSPEELPSCAYLPRAPIVNADAIPRGCTAGRPSSTLTIMSVNVAVRVGRTPVARRAEPHALVVKGSARVAPDRAKRRVDVGFQNGTRPVRPTPP